jgi:hypothetical protein
MEMRRELRYRLDVPVLFSWQGARHKHLHGEGATRDLSALGAFIVTSTCPPPETPVQVEVVLPSLTGRNSGIRIKGEARVIRVEHPSGSHRENGFAVVRDDMDQWSLAMAADDSEFIPPMDVAISENRTANS